MAIAILFLTFVVGAALGFPLGLSLIGSGVAYLFASGQDVGLVLEQISSRLFASYVLIAIPLFIFAANVMNAGTITERLLEFGVACVGRVRGGLAHANILTSLVFSGMSGSAVADAAGPGKVMIEMMRRDNRYPEGFAVAVTAASATIGPIIPPSIPLVLYALVANTSVGALFLGGVVPGLLLTVSLMAAVWLIARRRRFPTEAPIPWRAYPRILLRAFLPMMMPVILLTGIYTGVTTATEAAAVAAAYALILAIGVYRVIGWASLFNVLLDSAKATSIVAVAVSGAFIFNFAITNEQVPALLASQLAGAHLTPISFLIVTNIAFLILGCFFDVAVMLLVLVPLLVPTMQALGVDPVHFGVVIVFNIMIGLVTPPYGLLLFVLSSLTDVRLGTIIREVIPFLCVLLSVLVALIFVPELVLWLPGVFGYSAAG
jgi:tripartite ATP-independent transporter DctM subunit